MRCLVAKIARTCNLHHPGNPLCRPWRCPCSKPIFLERRNENSAIDVARFSLSRTDLEGLNSRNRMLWSRAHRCRNTSMPKPPPPMACTFESSSTTIRASVCEVTMCPQGGANGHHGNAPQQNLLTIAARNDANTLFLKGSSGATRHS